MSSKGGYVYIVTNKYRTTLYIGVTNNLYARAYEHKIGEGSGFTQKYQCHDLVYYEFMITLYLQSSVRNSSKNGKERGRID